MRRYLVWVTLVLVSAGAISYSLASLRHPSSDPPALVRILASEAAPTPGRSMASAEMPADLSGAPGTTVVSLMAQPDDLRALLHSEARDPRWARRSEAAIRDEMRRFDFFSAGRPVEVECAATVCEVRGVAAAETTEALKLRWQELEQFAEGDALTPAGLLAAASTFGTRDDPYAFVLHYRRADAPADAVGRRPAAASQFRARKLSIH